MTTNVLFVCPHSAGKSLLAATYTRAAAAREGLDLAIEIAGPDPDPVVMPNVEAALIAQGFSIGWGPRLISSADTEQANLVVSVGCPEADIPEGSAVTHWDVPNLSDDFDGSIRAIHAHAEQFVQELRG